MGSVLNILFSLYVFTLRLSLSDYHYPIFSIPFLLPYYPYPILSLPFSLSVRTIPFSLSDSQYPILTITLSRLILRNSRFVLFILKNIFSEEILVCDNWLFWVTKKLLYFVYQYYLIKYGKLFSCNQIVHQNVSPIIPVFRQKIKSVYILTT